MAKLFATLRLQNILTLSCLYEERKRILNPFSGALTPLSCLSFGVRFPAGPFFIGWALFLASDFENENISRGVMIYQDRIRRALTDHDISAEDLCKIVGVSPASLSRFMTRNANLPELVE